MVRGAAMYRKMVEMRFRWKKSVNRLYEIIEIILKSNCENALCFVLINIIYSYNLIDLLNEFLNFFFFSFATLSLLLILMLYCCCVIIISWPKQTKINQFLMWERKIRRRSQKKREREKNPRPIKCVSEIQSRAYRI